ncbi:MAG TPA: class I adenylate cyclase [Gammaproteobacteria bacterium]|nr:class I adenylate cyclase [Gammaproteobacteria bacterium]
MTGSRLPEQHCAPAVAGDKQQTRIVNADFRTRPAIDIDALELRAVRRRFLALNKDRLQRVRESLEPRQRIFVQLLPLLFHINHPMLPGYVSKATPCGISGYAPGKRCIQSARKLARSFCYQRRAQRRYSIHALYLMGSTGTIAYSRHSDFDVWLCHRPGLPEHDVEALREKAEGIRSWAESLGLEVHFFLMDDASFRNGKHQQLSNENAGSSQHHLLLDEFYRTALLLAGRFPVWWLVPARYEARYQEYVDKLIVNRFIKAGDIVDFGSLACLPCEEFFGATLWQLYKAVDSPYKSILKILLMEAYASRHPDVELLAMRFKRLLHSTEARLDRLDPYVMMCEAVEEYLCERDEPERLDLARRCFYFKINEPLSRPDLPGQHNWRREAVRELVRAWGWSQAKLASLDQRRHWKIERVLDERRLLVGELTRSYRTLSRFGREPGRGLSIDAEDLNLLGRKLYVAFERKAGKVEMINPGISGDLSEEQLSLHHDGEREDRGWVLYRGKVSMRRRERHRPLKRSAGLLELLAWGHFNGLINRQPSTIHIQPPDCTLGQWELRCVLDCLQQLFPHGRLPQTDMRSLAAEATIVRAGLFINLARDPMSRHTRNGMQLVSERIDPLSYGGQWENLAVTFELIAASSWGEVQTFRYASRTALVDCLCDYLAWFPLGGGTRPPALPCFSFSSSRGAIIARRMEDLYRDVSHFFYRNSHGRHARYVLRVGRQYYVLQCENEVPRYRELDCDSGLLRYLGEPQDDYSPIRIDPQALDDSPLPLLLQQNQAGVIQFFYLLEGAQALIYILDERGSLFHQRVTFHDRKTLLGQFQRFLDSVRYRMLNMNLPHGLSPQHDFQYFRIDRDPAQQYCLEALEAPQRATGRHYLDVQVIGDPDAGQGDSFSIFCGEREFSSLEHGDEIYRRVAEYITRQRSSGSHYPVYISDIDLGSSASVVAAASGIQSIHFLAHKKRIESRLNAALHGN